MIYGYDLVEGTRFQMSIKELCRIQNWIKDGVRVKALEYLSDQFDDDIMKEERTNND